MKASAWEKQARDASGEGPNLVCLLVARCLWSRVWSPRKQHSRKLLNQRLSPRVDGWGSLSQPHGVAGPKLPMGTKCLRDKFPEA